MRRSARWIRSLAAAAACAAAYALVLQLMLVNALAASAPLEPGVGAEQHLCLGDASGDAAPPSKIHCTLCCCRVDAAALPPAPSTPLIDRFAIELVFETARRAAALASAPRSAFQPRGPPPAA